ncbi:MAG: type VII secretion protein EccCa [Actinomycetota bacterium]
MTTTTYRRSGRQPGPELPDGELMLQEPPELPARKPKSFAHMFMMLPMALGMGVGALVMFRPGGNAASALMPAMMGMSMVGMGVMTMTRGGGERKRELNGIRRDYMRYLGQTRRKVRRIADQQRAALLWRHPDPASLHAVIGGDRMWERRANDDDFGHVRIATGTQRLRVRLQPPETKPAEDLEPLCAVSMKRFLEANHSVPDLPVSVSVRAFANVLLRGHGDDVDAMARAMICQLAALHSPDDLRMVVCAAPERVGGWEWMKWLPHAQHPLGTDAAGNVRLFADDLGGLAAVLGGDELNERPRFSPNGQASPGDPQVLVVLDGVEVPAGSRMTTYGYAGVTVVDVGGSLFPHAQSFTLELDVAPGELHVVPAREDDDRRHIGRPDRLSVVEAERIARALSSFRPPAGGNDAEEQSVADVDFGELVSIPDARNFDPQRMWQTRPSSEHLRVPIGVNDQGVPIDLDLKEAAQGGFGPHGMLVGATGSGKSELLRTLILSLACTHSSESLNLILVDFKGGSAFLGLEDLPHVSAIITNLADELPLVDRMQDAIHGEMVRRQELLRDAGYSSLRDYEKARAKGTALPPLPSLLVILDEFSELLSAKREFLDLFVMVGRLGRSLGVHLLLATQRLDDGRIHELSSHLSYRIGLKMFSAQESRSVLGVTDAFDQPLPPGGGFLQTDRNPLEQFTGAYVSAPLRERAAVRTASRPSVANEIVPFGTTYIAPTAPLAAHDDADVNGDEDSDDDQQRDTLLSVLADRIVATGSPPAHRVWLPPLSDAPAVDQLLPDGDLADGRPSTPFDRLVVPVGYVDKPFEQRWDYLVADLSGAGGHVGIAGGTQSGKSTMIRTLILALAATHRPSQVQFYCLDFGGGGLATLKDLAHVGSVAARRDKERVERTVAEMINLLGAREELFAEHGIDSIADYRRRRAEGEFADEPYADDVFFIVDGWYSLREDYEAQEGAVKDLVMRGISFGIHLVTATTRWADARPWLRDNLGTKFELRLGDPIDSVIKSKLAANVPAVPGRGLTVDGLHFLSGLPRFDGGCTIDDLPEVTRDAVAKINAVWPDERAPEVRLVPTVLDRAELPEPQGDERRESDLVVPIGLAADDLEPVWHDFGEMPHLIVVGDSQSGKTNLLRAIGDAIVDRMPPSSAQIMLADYRRHLTSAIPEANRLAFAASASALKEMVVDTVAALAPRVPGQDIDPDRLASRDWWTGKKLFVIIDDYDLVATGMDSPLQPFLDLLPAGADIGLHLVVARAAAGAARGMNDQVLRRMTELGTPIVLLSCPKDEGNFGSVRAREMPVGRGHYITRRTARQFQTVCATDLEAAAAS